MTALMGWIAIVLAGGAALGLAVCPSMLRKPVLLVAVSAPLSAALTYGVAMGLNVVGIGPWPWVVVVDAVIIVVGASRAAAYHRSAPRAAIDPSGTEDHRGRTAARWLLGAAVITAAAVWLVPGSPAVPKNRDVKNHAYFVARISYENSVDTSVVLAASPTVDEPVAQFYPLAAHTQMASVQRLTGAATEDLLMYWTLLATVVTWPLGLFALARRLIPDKPVVAGWAALAGACTALFPYQPMAWGGIAMVASLATVPAVAALSLEAIDSGLRKRVDGRSSMESVGDGSQPGSWALIVLAAGAVAGMSFIHTTQAALMALLLAAFACHDLIASDSRRAVFRRWGALAAASALLLAPLAQGLLAGGDERASHSETLSESAADVAWRIVAFDAGASTTQLMMGLLVLAGIAVMVMRRNERPPARMWAILAVFGFLCLVLASLTLTGPIWEAMRPAALPWYRSWWRMPYYLAALAPLFAALALSAAADSLARAFSWSRPAVPGAVLAVMLVSLSVPTIGGALEAAGIRNEVITPGQREMFQELGRAVKDGETRPIVLNQENDGTAWAYVTDEIPTFSGLRYSAATPGKDEMLWLLDNTKHLADDPEVAAEFESWGIGWVLVRDGTYSDEPSLLKPDDLLRADGFEVAAHEGSLWLFEVDPAAAARAG